MKEVAAISDLLVRPIAYWSKQMARIILTTVICIAGITTNAYACCGGGPSLEGGIFWSADLNGNDELDRVEAKAVFNLSDEQVFEKYDSSGEGVISRLEFIEYYRLRSDDE